MAGRIRSALNALFGRAGSPSGGYGSSAWSGGPSSPDAFGAKRQPTPWQLVETYKSIIYFCVELNANAVAATPLRLYAKQARGEMAPRCLHRTLEGDEAKSICRRLGIARSLAGAVKIHEIFEHPILQVLDKPCIDMNREELIGLLVRYLDVVGIAYLKPVMAGKFLAEMWPLQSQYVYPIQKANSALIDRYNYFADSYAFDELLRVRGMSLKNPFGAWYGPTQAACEYAGLEDKFISIQDQLLGQGPRPSAIVSPTSDKLPMGPTERKLLEQDLNRKHARGNAGGAWVPAVPVKVDILGWKPMDLGGVTLSTYDLERTMNCFGVPPSYATRETNMANLEASHRYHAEKGVAPRCGKIAGRLTAFAQTFDPRLFMAFDDLLGEDEERDAKVREVRHRNGVLLTNEWRALDGLEPIENGDVPLVDNKLTTLQAVIDGPPEPEPPPGEEDPEADQAAAESEDDEKKDVKRALELLEGFAREANDPPRRRRRDRGTGVQAAEGGATA